MGLYLKSAAPVCSWRASLQTVVTSFRWVKQWVALAEAMAKSTGVQQYERGSVKAKLLGDLRASVQDEVSRMAASAACRMPALRWPSKCASADRGAKVVLCGRQL